MTATDALPPSPSRAPGASRESWQREPKSVAPGDAVALFAEMVSRATERLDGAPSSAPDAIRPDKESADRNPSPDEVLAAISSLPAAREARAAGEGTRGGQPAAAQAVAEHGASRPGATKSPDAAAGDDIGAAAEAALPRREASANVRGTPGSQAGQLPLDHEENPPASNAVPAAPPDAAGEAGKLESGRESPRAGMAPEATGPRDPRSAAKQRHLPAAELGSSSRQPSDAVAAAAARASATPAAADATAAATATTAAAAAAAGSAAAANGAAALDRGRSNAARRGTPDSATASIRGGSPAGSRHGARLNDTAETALTRSASGLAQAAADGTTTGSTAASTSAQAALSLDAGSFAAAMDTAGATSEAQLATEPTLHQLGIEIPVQDEAFAEAFARQATHLVIQGGNRAEIHLTPRELGPVRIAIEIDLDTASLDIAADRHETRAAIEASMPTLRQMLADQGVRLSDWRVGGDTADRRQGAAGDGGAAFGSPAGSGGGNGGLAQGNARGLPDPTSLPDRGPQGGLAGGDRAGAGASAAQAASGPDAPRGGNRLDLFA